METKPVINMRKLVKNTGKENWMRIVRETVGRICENDL
jgi:hypothetical protein